MIVILKLCNDIETRLLSLFRANPSPGTVKYICIKFDLLWCTLDEVSASTLIEKSSCLDEECLRLQKKYCYLSSQCWRISVSYSVATWHTYLSKHKRCCDNLKTFFSGFEPCSCSSWHSLVWWMWDLSYLFLWGRRVSNFIPKVWLGTCSAGVEIDE